jgi:coiled-coil domain-containing protein 55
MGGETDATPSSAGGASALAYGLNLPTVTTEGRGRGRGGGTKGTRPPTPAAFANDSDDDDDDDDDGDDPVKARARANAEVRRQQEATAAKRARDAANAAATTSAALKEDANAFEYDAVFDDIERSRGHKAKELANERVERKSRYIEDLMAKANARRKENDASYERRLLKERLKEDHLYADKDKFVTAAYRAKLKEDAKWLAEEKVRDAMEEEEDVTRRGASAMTAFYSNVLHGKTSSTGGKTPENDTSKHKLTSAADRDRELIARAQAEAAATIPAIPEDVTLVERVEKPAPPEPTSAAVETKVDPNARRNTDSDVSDARARYLARKRKAT